MRKIARYLLSIAGVLIVAGCATTDDPRQGGLFGYNPAAYEKRLAERQAKSDELQTEKDAEQQKTEQLQQELSQKQSEKDLQARKLAEMDQQIAAIEKKMAKSKGKTEAQKQQYSRLNNGLQRVKQQMTNATTAAPAGDEAAKRKEIERLNTEIDRLLQEADALAGM